MFEAAEEERLRKVCVEICYEVRNARITMRGMQCEACGAKRAMRAMHAMQNKVRNAKVQCKTCNSNKILRYKSLCPELCC